LKITSKSRIQVSVSLWKWITVPRNSGDNSLRDMASQPRIFESSTLPMWKPQTQRVISPSKIWRNWNICERFL